MFCLGRLNWRQTQTQGWTGQNGTRVEATHPQGRKQEKARTQLSMTLPQCPLSQRPKAPRPSSFHGLCFVLCQ